MINNLKKIKKKKFNKNKLIKNFKKFFIRK
jgi:hypothetical protein